jgi:aryl-alcohol dehydrogenase-like predicted oxidoreductase
MATLRQLGKTSIEVTPVGLGCWQFSSGKGLAGKFWEKIPQLAVNGIVAAALAGGVNWFDTAEMYGNGASERTLSAALRQAGKSNGDVVIASKWNPFFRTQSSIRSTIRQRRGCLAPFAIDLHQVHNPFGLSTVESEMAAMAELVAAGDIRAVGVSNFNAARMRRAHAALKKQGLVLASNQVKYSLLDRRVETRGILAAARELGITIIAYSPLEQGLLTSKYPADRLTVKKRPGPRKWMRAFRTKGLARSRSLIKELGQVARAHGATAGQVALAWLCRFHADLVVVIPGSSRVEQAVENCGALDLILSPLELDRLDQLSRPFR